MPGNRDGSVPDDYAEYKRKQAQEVPVRDVEDSDETPEERFKRHLQYSVPEDESSDARTQRHLEKARVAGYTHESPSGQPLGHDITSSLDKLRGEDFAEQDDRIRSGVVDVLAPKRATDAAERVGGYVKQNLSEGFRARLRSMVENYAGTVNPLAHQAGMDRQLEDNRRAIEIARKYANPRDEGEIDDPAPVRQPAMMQREFSNDQEKELYLQKVRKAMAAAKK